MVIGIIGCSGKYGVWLTRFFRSHGFVVIGSDIGTELNNHEVVQRADVVIFALTIRHTAEAIRDLIADSRSEQLWLDITSVKPMPIREMLKSKASVVGLHPMCAPPPQLNLRGQKLVVYRARCTKQWFDWLSEKVVEPLGAKVLKLSPALHDRRMLPVQGVPQIGSVAGILAMRALGLTMQDAFDVASPVMSIMLSVGGRILSQPELYVDILAHNDQMAVLLEEMLVQLQRITAAVESGDLEELDRIYQEAVEHFGQQRISKSFSLFQKLSRVMADLSKEQSVTVEASEDRPGMLAEAAAIFARHQVNLTAFHSLAIGDGTNNHQFQIGFAQPVSAPEVTTALDELRTLPWVRKII